MRRLLQPFPWRLLAHLCLGIVLAPLLGIAVLVGGATLLVTAFTVRPFLVIAHAVAGLVSLDRARFDILARVQLGRPLALYAATAPQRERARLILGDRGNRRVVGYVVVRLALAALEFALVTALITAPLLVVFTVAAAGLTPYRPGLLNSLWDPVRLALAAAAAIIGVAVIAPSILRGLTRLDAWVTQALLGSVETEALAERVGELVEARARTVSAADAERAKLERDLHDGAQQRLIALSVLLGQAEARLTDSPTPAADDATLALIRRARAETGGTIDELRTLTRGLRPPVLEARGLDAGLSAVASRLPMPVTIEVDLPRRPDPALEAMLYFAITEALTNVAKHAGGAPATVSVTEAAGVLRAVVTDTGPGGADVAGGTGLRGIANRLSGVDGRLFLSSPPGGPTQLIVEVPCA